MEVTSDLRKAVVTLAKALRQTCDLFDMNGTDAKAYYHAVEYYDQMKELLLEQLLTDIDEPEQRDTILRENGLEDLIDDLHLKASEWRNE